MTYAEEVEAAKDHIQSIREERGIDDNGNPIEGRGRNLNRQDLIRAVTLYVGSLPLYVV